jgi:glutamyl-tRNA synthetase
LKEKLLPFWQAFGVDTQKFEDQYLVSIAALEQERLKKLSEIGERTSYFFSQPQYEPELLVWKKSDKQDAKQKLAEVCVLLSKMSVSEFKKVTLESNLKEFIQSKSYDTGAVLWPLRVAMTGLKASPGPFEVLETLILGLGQEAVLERLKVAEGKL